MAGFATGGLGWGLVALLGSIGVLGSTGGVSHAVARRWFLERREQGEHQIDLSDQRVAIAPDGGAPGGARWKLSRGRGGHNPPDNPDVPRLR